MFNELLVFAIKPTDNPGSVEELNQHHQYAITPIEHDYAGKTPAMWNTAYRHFGMDAVMTMMVGDPARARGILESFRNDPKYIGGGSGVGFKDENVKFVDELDPLASAIGSINLIEKLPSGKLKGWNTDGIGYARSLEDLLREKDRELRGAKVVMLGAGGTANSIAFALAERGARVCIANRTIEKAQELARRVNDYFGGDMAKAIGEDAVGQEVRDAMVVINVSTKGATGAFERYFALVPAKLPATPENLAENKAAADRVFDVMPKNTIVSDVVLRDTPTPMLERARAKGFFTLDGIPMVVNQGVEAFLILHGKEVGLSEEVRNTLREIMKKAAGF